LCPTPSYENHCDYGLCGGGGGGGPCGDS